MKKARVDFDKEAAKAASLIVQSLSDDIYMVIDSISKDPKEIWTWLVARFERITANEADRVEKVVLSFEQKRGETADDTITRWDVIEKKAKTQGCALSAGTLRRALLARCNDQ